jgi:hypothetical protein
MRMLTQEETVQVSGGDEFWSDVESWGEDAALAGIALCAVVAVAPEAVTLGAITEGALVLGADGEYVAVSQEAINDGTAAVRSALQGAGAKLTQGGTVATIVAHKAQNYSGAS